MSDYGDRVERNLRGLNGVSVGVCGGCDECAHAYGYRPKEDDDGEPIETDAAMLARFGEAVSTGRVPDEGGFSWEDCGICGSSLGGDRFYWHALNDRRQLLHFNDACVDCARYLANGDEPEEG